MRIAVDFNLSAPGPPAPCAALLFRPPTSGGGPVSPHVHSLLYSNVYSLLFNIQLWQPVASPSLNNEYSIAFVRILREMASICSNDKYFPLLKID